MSEPLTIALEEARSRLTSGVEEAEAELRRARARARELRMSLAMARELAGMGAGIEGTVRSVDRSRTPGRARLDLTHTAPVAAPPSLSLRQLAALESIRRTRTPARMWPSFSRAVALTWEGESPFAGEYAGRRKALALLELVLREVDPAVDPEPRLRAEGDAFRVEVRFGLRGAPGARVPLSALIRFDDRGRIDRMSLRPEEGNALDRLVAAVIGDDG